MTEVVALVIASAVGVALFMTFGVGAWALYMVGAAACMIYASDDDV